MPRACCQSGDQSGDLSGDLSDDRSIAMDSLYLLLPLSLVLVFLIGAVFWWALRSGQFDDLEGPRHRLLDDDDRPSG
jgi:cbb3-type cytochrome oxidase maturation protein